MKKINSKKIRIFEFLNQINYKTKIHKYDKKIAPKVLLSYWLSHDINILDAIQRVNEILFYLPDEIVYKYYYHNIPKKRRFLKWTPKNISKNKSKMIDALCEKYNISRIESLKIISEGK